MHKNEVEVAVAMRKKRWVWAYITGDTFKACGWEVGELTMLG